MKKILLKEVALNAAEELTELFCVTRLRVYCRVEKGVTPQTVDCIISIEDDDIIFTARHTNEVTLFEFTGIDEVMNFEIPDNSITDIVIR